MSGFEFDLSPVADIVEAEFAIVEAVKRAGRLGELRAHRISDCGETVHYFARSPRPSGRLRSHDATVALWPMDHGRVAVILANYQGDTAAATEHVLKLPTTRAAVWRMVAAMWMEIQLV